MNSLQGATTEEPISFSRKERSVSCIYLIMINDYTSMFFFSLYLQRGTTLMIYFHSLVDEAFSK